MSRTVFCHVVFHWGVLLSMHGKKFFWIGYKGFLWIGRIALKGTYRTNTTTKSLLERANKELMMYAAIVVQGKDCILIDGWDPSVPEDGTLRGLITRKTKALFLKLGSRTIVL